MSSLKEIFEGLPINPLPPRRPRDENVPHAPTRTPELSTSEERLALQNALRYFPPCLHETLAPEFVEELRTYGHIYMYRFRPTFEIRAYPVQEIPSNCRDAAAIIHMILNNLDPRVAQFPHELVTYGGNGQVFANWAQFWLVMKYLSEMTDDQTLVMYSGHPAGLFPSSPSAPRLIITNGMVIPNYSSRPTYEKMFALGVSMYGQMTAGSYCYIGPQGIVHGTTLTVLNAARKHLDCTDLKGKVFVSSGLGGMSGAQPKAATIAGCVGVVAEVSKEALDKRYRQGWVMFTTNSLDECISITRKAREQKLSMSIGYHGNIVDLWERFVEEYENTGDMLVDLGSDQTSCHNPFLGGYYPVQLSYDESRVMMHEDPTRFKNLVQESLQRHVAAINKLTVRGMFFFDYGNAFLLEASRAGADVGWREGINGTKFRYPSYVQDIMGDIFSLGFGPFRWVCTSGDPRDLDITDEIASSILEGIIQEGGDVCSILIAAALNPESPQYMNHYFAEYLVDSIKQQYEDNIRWIKGAKSNKLVVGSQARILYSDQKGRILIAMAFNRAVAEKRLKGPVVISRDHHDVSGTDSPFRETSNIYDGSAFCADMAVQNCIGDACRGATWVAIHNGGGVGWGEVINGGFGLVLNGSEDAGERVKRMLSWDVSNGVARRCWAGNNKAEETICRTMDENPKLKVTLPYHVDDDDVLDRALRD